MFQVRGKTFKAKTIGLSMSFGVGSFMQTLACLAILVELFMGSSSVHADAVNLYTGDASYTVPIVTPPGTNGMGPNLSLSYSSGGGDDSWLGTGWSLQGLGSIERFGPSYSLAPTYTANDTYRLNMTSGGKLVCEKDSTGNCTNVYHTQIESFLRIEFVSASNYWVVTDKGGTKYFFGQTAASQQNIPGSANLIFSWKLDKVLDTHGVFWTVVYSKNPTNGDMAPQSILYSQGSGLPCTASGITAVDITVCRSIDFFSEGRPDYTNSYVKGGRITTTARLRQIDVKLGFKLIKRYTLGYTTRAQTARGYAAVSQLTSITETGADGITSLPATTFIYNVDLNGANLALNTQTNTLNPTEAISASCTVTIDINGDGVTDILVGKAGNWYYYNGWDYSPSSIPNPPTALPSLCTTSTQIRWGSRALTYYGGSISIPTVTEVTMPVFDTMLADMDGDGLVDVVNISPQGQWYWWRNTTKRGDIFPTFADRAVINGLQGLQLNDVGIRFADMNGDGLVDIVRIPANSSDVNTSLGLVGATVNIYLSQGRDTSGVITFVTPSSNRLAFNISSYGGPVNEWHKNIFTINDYLTFFPGNIRLADMNGDGLPDLVWLAVDGEIANGMRNRIYYYPNMGGDKFGPLTQIIKPDSNGVNVLQVQQYTYPTATTAAYQLSEYHRLVDMNGDGLLDLLTVSAVQCSYYPLQANGNFGDPVNLQNCGMGQLSRGANNALGDINADGFPDIIHGESLKYTKYSLYSDNSHQKLTTTRNSVGGTTDIHYVNNYDTGIPRWVVSQTIQNDNLNSASYTNYSFSGGEYVGWPTNEFRGYSLARVTDSVAHYTDTHFYQDAAMQGKISGVFTYNNQSQYQKGLFYNYNVTTPLAGVSRSDLLFVQEDTIDGGTTAKYTRTDYANYDNYGNASQVTVSGTDISPRVTTTDFVYNTTDYIVNRPSHTVMQETSTSGMKINETWYDYDFQANGVAPTQGDLTRETHWLSGGVNPVINYAYDNVGNRINVLDANGNLCTNNGWTNITLYDSVYLTFPRTEINALCQITSKTYWGVNDTALAASNVAGAYAVPGQLATVTDVNGVRSDSYWDSLGRPKASVIPPDNAAYPTTVWNYEVTGAVPSDISESKRETPGAAGTLDKITYVDGFGRTIQVKGEAKTAGQWTTQDTWYNSRGLAESISVPYITSSSAFTALDANQYKTTTLYDAMQRPTKVTNPDNTYRTFVYTPYVVASTDENFFTTTRTYDALKRLISVVEPTGGGTTNYYNDNYDSTGSHQIIIDAAGNFTQLQFDTLGRTLSSYDADRGWRLYTYDANNNLLTQTDGKWQLLTYTYDKLNRIYTKTYPGGGGVITYNYDDPTSGTDRIGRLWKVTDLTGSSVFTYDQRGHQTQVDKTIDAGTYTTKYTYDSLGRVTTMIYPNNEYVGFLYNSQGLLNSVNNPSGSYVSNLDYNALGQVVSKTLGNGKVTTYDYYPDSQRLRNIATPLLQSLAYSYDNIGNVKNITDNISGSIQNFGYDNMHRLSSASDISAPAYNYSYSYDVIGNMKTGAGKTLAYPLPGAARPHAPISDGSCSYLYDANGSTSSRTCGTTLRTFTWDFDNRLIQVKNGSTVIETNNYDYAGVRVKKVEGTTTTLTPFPFYRLVNGAATKYYFANGQRIAEKDPAGVASYYHSDHLGSSNKVSSSTGAEVKFTQFYPFGATRTETGSKTIVHKFTGQEIDTSTGLYNYGARFYDPAIMHFLSADDIIPSLDDPQTLNRFAYANNNPIKYIDPTGKGSIAPSTSVNAWYLSFSESQTKGFVGLNINITGSASVTYNFANQLLYGEAPGGLTLKASLYIPSSIPNIGTNFTGNLSTDSGVSISTSPALNIKAIPNRLPSLGLALGYTYDTANLEFLYHSLIGKYPVVTPVDNYAPNQSPPPEITKYNDYYLYDHKPQLLTPLPYGGFGSLLGTSQPNFGGDIGGCDYACSTPGNIYNGSLGYSY
ncbi:MAG: VCBS repeat-containing protein [Gammaproteobacteria bacterium]|nr:VCBS repeat-containing protein [Gammaproteobacteria bacterium]